MTLAVRPSGARRPTSDTPHRIGDQVGELAHRYAGRMHDSPFATDLRARKVDKRRYVSFLCTMYPAVVGFNRALIRGIAKVDHVRHASFVKALAEQLQEEQAHNQLWRVKLELFGVDHEALYGDLVDYLERYSTAELDRMMEDVLSDVRLDLTDGASGRFPGAIFPDAVLALYHHLWMTASRDDIGHWEHFASQAGMEMVIYDVVTTSILPGVLGHSELDLGTGSTQWWREHGQVPGVRGLSKTDEEKHLELSRLALNRSETANAVAHLVVARAEDTLRLFAASLLAQEAGASRFPLDRYLK